jgi:adenylate cyclase
MRNGMRDTLVGAFLRYADTATLPEDSGEQRLLKRIIMVVSTFVPFYIVGIGVIYLIYQEFLPGWVTVAVGLYSWLNAFLFARVHRHPQRFFWITNFGIMFAYMIAAFYSTFVNGGGLLLWGLVYPCLFGLMCVRARQLIPFFLWYLVLLVINTAITPYYRPITSIPQTLTLQIFAVNLVAVSVNVLAIVAYFVYQRNVALALLRGEQVKTDNLLLNILPAEIASILKEEPRTIAEHYEGVSVLFADVVNFTPLSATMTPVELVNLLNEVFSYFDTLVDKYDLEKIKTIGDCYMVASGVPRRRADHAHAIIRMGLEMQAYIDTHTFSEKKIAFRVGINSGEVVAGVIGRKKFIYDLWGDAVNTASRMESHGAGGSIQITRSTYDLIHADFDCEPRGTMYIKGKGEMETWFVLSENTPAANPTSTSPASATSG